MEGGAASQSGPFQDQKGDVPVTIPPILIRAPISEDLEDVDNDKESFDTEEEGGEGEEYFESASERMAGSPVGSFTNNTHYVAISVAKVRDSDSDSADSHSSSSSSSSVSSSASRRPRIRPVAKVSGDDDEQQPPREELVDDSEEEEGFTVAKVPPLGFVKEGGFESMEMGGDSEVYGKAFTMGTGSPESAEPRVSDTGLHLGLALGEPEVAKSAVLNDVDDALENFGDKKEGVAVDAGEVVDRSRAVSEQNGVATEEGEETSVIERGKVIETGYGDVLEKAGVGDESHGVGIDKAVDGTALLENNGAESGGTVEREFVGAGEDKSETDGIQGAEENSNVSQVEEVIVGQDVGEGAGGSEADDLQESDGGIRQEAVEECVPEDFDAKEGGDKGDDILEPAVNSTPETGAAEVQAAAKEDVFNDSESYLEKLVQENVTSDPVKAIDCSSDEEDFTQDSNANEKYDAQDSKVNEIATASPLTRKQSIDTEGTVEVGYALNDHHSLDSELKHEVASVEEVDDASESKHEVATVEELDDASESKHEVAIAEEVDDAPGLKHEVATVEQRDDAPEIEAEDIEESKNGMALSQRELKGSSESKENIDPEVPVTNTVRGGQAQGDTSKPETLLAETLDTELQSNVESFSRDPTIQKIADDENGEMVDSSALAEVVGCAVNVSLVDNNLEKVSNKESTSNEAYEAQDRANEVSSASYVTSQHIIDKEAIVESGSVICDHSLLKSESNQGFATTEKPDDTQEAEAADMHQGKAVENQTVMELNYTDGITREEAKFCLESQQSRTLEDLKEAMLGSLESKECNDSSKSGAYPDDSDTLIRTYFPTFDQDNKDNVLDDEETLASYANPQFTFESSSGDDSVQKVVGRMATDWDDEDDDDEDDEDEDEEMADPAALAALMEVASSAVTGSNNSSFGAAGFPVSTRPAGLGASVPSLDPIPRYLHHSRSNGAAVSRPSPSVEDNQRNGDSGDGYDETQEKLQMIRVKFLRVVLRLGQTPQNVVVTQVLYRLGLAEGLKRGTSANRVFNSDRAITIAEELETAGQEDLDFTCNILVLGKSGVGKSATINSIFDESKSATDAFQPATYKVREILGSVHGIKVRVVDTPGLMPSSADQRRNKNIISSVKKFIKKCPPDIVLYFDRLDVQSRDYSDLPLLKLVTETFGAAIWFNTIVVLTHASSAPPDGANGTPLSYDMFVAQRSHIVQHSIRQAAGDMRLMNPVSLVENHSACRRNREGHRVLPNGQVWKPQLLLLCLSSKVLAEANALLKLQDSTPGKPLRTRAPPLPFLLSSLLQSRAQLKAPEEDEEEIDSDEDLDAVSDTEGEDEYDRLPPFKYLTNSELSKLTKEQREAYLDEKYHREKLYQKKQWKEELKRRRNMKKKPATSDNDDDEQSDLPDPEPAPMPDMAMPQTFDSENPTYRYRYLDSASQWLIRPVLDTNGWDHDIGYDGVNAETTLVISGKIPASVSGQITKDKKEVNFQMDCAASLKHGERSATLASFDVQSVGRGLAYTLRSETRFSNFKRNKTTGGLSLTYLGNTLATGVKLEDSLTVGKRLKIVVNGGAMRGRGDVAYGGSLEATLRDKDYPLGQMLSTMGVSVMNWHGDLAIGGNLQSQFTLGRKWRIVTRANINNRRSGQISIRTSSSEQLQIALIGLIPIIRTIIRGRLFDPPFSA